MCTYNGAAWVEPQLRSLFAQSQLPDELIVCDDHSTDGTARIVSDFARSAPFPVRLIVNPIRLGVAANFSQAIRLCTGHLIALCDQDDRWGAAKIQTLSQALQSRPDWGFVFCDANLVDEALNPIGTRLWDTLYLDRPQRRRLSDGQAVQVLTRTNVVTGATMMFRACFKPLILPISPDWLHDGWIALLLAAVAGCGMVDQPLIDYRQHPRQQIGARKTGLLEQIQIGLAMDPDYFRRESVRWTDAYQRLAANRNSLRSETDLDLLRQKAVFSRDRYAMRLEPTSRWEHIGRYWYDGTYREMAWGWKSLLQDVVIQA